MENEKLEADKLKNEQEQSKKRIEIAKLSAQSALVQSAAQAALSIGAIAAQSAKQDFTFGIATVASIAAVLASVTAAITSAKQLSQFEEGGIIEGPSHAEGGVKAIVGGKRMVELEGRELIVNKNVWSRPDFVKAISKMNAATGGKDFFAQGGVPDMSNINQVLQGGNLQSLLMANLQKPIYTSVVDITKAQTRVNKIKEMTSFGNL
jgi:hypothetical protein